MINPISSMMQREVWTADLDDSMAAVERLLADKHLSWVPVRQSGGAVLGVISATDLLQFHAEKRDPEAVYAWQMCSYKPIAVAADASVAEVARKMVEQHVHHVVVMDQGDIVGVVSALDFVRAFASGSVVLIG
jgi:CBS domain-containing protein